MVPREASGSANDEATPSKFRVVTREPRSPQAGVARLRGEGAKARNEGETAESPMTLGSAKSLGCRLVSSVFFN